jgi:fatty-acyl-CoA synthase
MFLDLTFVPLMEKLADRLTSVERFIVLTDGAHMPATRLKKAVAYEDWLAESDHDFRWAEFDENTAAGLCYTSGTTGEPKGVLYSHRSNVLHAMMTVMPDAFGLSTRDIVLPVVPLFHANSWSLAFAAPMAGAALVMPGPKLDGPSIYDMLTTERVTFTAGRADDLVLAPAAPRPRSAASCPTRQRSAPIGAVRPARARWWRLSRSASTVPVLTSWGMTANEPGRLDQLDQARKCIRTTTTAPRT